MAKGAIPRSCIAEDLGGFAGGERLNVRGSQRLAANRPIAAFKFVDADPSYWAHVLAFNLDHRLRDFGNKFLLLILGENILDHINGNEWHIASPVSVGFPATGHSRNLCTQIGTRESLKLADSMEKSWRFLAD
jgi:hypothetical protein